jgi:branched-chain amino acid transport system permease protein
MLGHMLPALLGQLLVGLINGAFYAMLSLGLALIFGMLRIVNMAHGAFYTLGAFAAWFLLNWFGVGYWGALVAAPLIVAALAVLIERTLLRWIYGIDHLYGLLLTLGIAFVIEGVLLNEYGSSGLPYDMPRLFDTTLDLGFMYLPAYRGWVLVASLVLCGVTYFVVERTKLGAYLRSATENPDLLETFGVNVPRMVTLTYALGAALAGVAGVLAAPIYQVSPNMGSDLLIVVFAVVVIGGLGSIAGSIATGFFLGLAEGLTKVFYPEASNMVIFAIMAVTLLVRPFGLFGRT